MLSSYIRIDDSFCNGCSKCVRACPTKALRIRNNKAVVFDSLCIGCGECIRVCPQGAVSSSISYPKVKEPGKVSVAIVSPILYAQFPGVMPCDVLVGLNNIGFDKAIDLSCYFEMYQYAVEEYIKRNRESDTPCWPLISPICPVVCRLIALERPSMLPHIAPIKRPVALVVEDLRKKVSQEYDIPEEHVVLYHITPCPSEMHSGRSGILDDLSEIDFTLGINDIYPDLFESVEAVKDLDLSLYRYQHLNFLPNARGPLWGMSGGEIAGIEVERVLAVSGLQETINYLEKIEMGLFKEMEFIEFRACQEGCLGGPLTAVDRYVARSTVQKLLKMFGFGRRLPRDKLKRLYDKGSFFAQKDPVSEKENFKNTKPSLTIEQMKQVEQILDKVQGNDCGACGAPDCRTFAEDVVRGYASLNDCYKFRLDETKG